MSSRWDRSYGDLIPSSYSSQMHRTSFSPSQSGSRGGSGGSMGYWHQQDASDTASSDVNSSPNSLQAPQWIPAPQDASARDVVATGPDSLSRPLDLAPAKEACIFTEATSSFASPSSASGNLGPSILRNLSGGLPKLGSKQFFSRQKSETRACQHIGMGTLEGGQSSEGQGAGLTDWSMQTFSQLMASSQRESLRWPNAGLFPEDGLDDGLPFILDAIRATPPPISSSPPADLEKCSLCSRWLLLRSPWSSQRMVSNNDFPVVGVLVCGHVYHADCLEKAVPEVLRHDPPCPQCDSTKFVSLRAQASPMKGTKEFLKNKVLKIGSQFWRRSSSLKSGGKLQASPLLSNGESGFFSRSLSKKHLFFRSKSNKDSSVQMLRSSKIFSSPAQVSPENQA